MGIKGLSKMQYGFEATAGTAVAASAIWRGPFAGLKDTRVVELVDEQIGVALRSSRNYAARYGAALSLPAQPLTPEQFPIILEAGIKAVGTGVADGTASSGYKYAYPFGSTSVNAVKSLTWETGDDSGAERAAYMLVEKFVISGQKGEALMMSADWFGRQVAPNAFTGALSAPAVSHVHASTGTLYIDDASGTIGSTQVSAGNILDFSLEVTTGRVANFTIDSGQLYFYDAHFDVDAFSAVLKVKWIHATAAIAEKVDWRANAARLVRLQFTGDAYGTPGTGTLLSGKKGISIDFPGAYKEFSEIKFEDGRSVVEATLEGGYDNTSGEALEITVANEAATLYS